MGSPKAGVELRGHPLISYPIAAARLARLAPFVVAKGSSELPPLGSPIVTEPEGPSHPLAGIVAALEHAEAPIVVVACDVPLVPAELLAELGHRRARFALPAHPRPQPLVARYSPGLLPRLREALAAGEALTAVVAGLGGDVLGERELRGFGDPDRMFFNVNSPHDLRHVATMLR